MSAVQDVQDTARAARPVRSRIPRLAEGAVDRVRLTVVPNRNEEAPLAPFVVLVLVLLAAGVAGLLAFNTHMQQTSFAATKLENRADALVARKQSLALDLERLRDPQALAARAKALGMVVPENPGFVRLSDGAILGQPIPATPEDAMRINPLPAVKPQSLAPPPKIVHVPAPEVVAPPAAGTPVVPAEPATGTTGAPQ